MERHEAETEVEKKAERNGVFKDVMAKMCIQIFKKTDKQNNTKTEKNKQRRERGKWKERKEETGFSNDVMPQCNAGERRR